jgi:hypothetical protein
MLAQRLTCLLAGMIFVTTALAIPSAPTLYGVTETFGGGPSRLITIDTNTAAISTVGALPAAVYVGLGTAPGGGIYAFNSTTASTGNLLHVSGVDASILNRATVNIGLTEGGLDIDANGNVFAVGNSSFGLVKFPLTGGSAQLVGQTIRDDNNVAVQIDGLAFDRNNVLFGISQSDGQLYTVNTTNGALHPLGASISTGITGGLAFESIGSTDFLFGASATALYSITASNGTPTLIGNLALNNNEILTGLNLRPNGCARTGNECLTQYRCVSTRRGGSMRHPSETGRHGGGRRQGCPSKIVERTSLRGHSVVVAE